MKSLAYKLYIQIFCPIFNKPIIYLSCLFALIGGYFTLCEIEQAAFNKEALITILREHYFVFLVVMILIVLFLNRQKAEKSAYLGDKDITISLKLANILSIKDSAIVIPTNTTFDTTMNGDFISEKSIQGKFQKKTYGVDFLELDKAIKSSLDEHYPNCYRVLTDRTKTNRNRYDIGTVAKVTYKGKHYYFLAVADVSSTGKPQNVTMQNMTQALVGLWDYLSKDGHTEPITVPVIGTGRAGLYDGTFEDVVHETIFSFATKSQDEFVSKKMAICIYPPALSDANVTWEKLCDYLVLQCQFFTENRKRIKNSQISGLPVN
ncbi:macro domain-containing protein [Faecalimonas sp.]